MNNTNIHLTTGSVRSVPQNQKTKTPITEDEAQHDSYVDPLLWLFQTLLHQELVTIDKAVSLNTMQTSVFTFLTPILIYHETLQGVLEQTQVVHENPVLWYILIWYEESRK